MGIEADFQQHLDSGLTTLARCWLITRRDGMVYGFTDHDLDLEFVGQVFRADSGLSAMSLQQTTGLSVDNTEALGALSDVSLTEADIDAGRFDGAEVIAWVVNWQQVGQRLIQFRGTIGELRRAGGAFQAELRGLTDLLNRPVGRVYQKACTAVLGDAACGIDTASETCSVVKQVAEVAAQQRFRWPGFDSFAPGWFTRGRFEVVSGGATGLVGTIKRDFFDADQRVIELWQPLRAEVVPGDQVKLLAGCDKRFETCRLKFANMLNFQGFPDLPGDEWVAGVPRSTEANSGASLRS